MNKAKLRNRIRVGMLVARFGLATSWEKDQRHWTVYQGDDVLRASNCSDMLHELAHYQVASPARRLAPDFRLGHSPSSKHNFFDKPPYKLYEFDSLEEQHASVLGILWERRLGLNWRETFGVHGWNNELKLGVDIRTLSDEDLFGGSALPVVSRLQQAGLLDGLAPRILLLANGVVEIP